MSKRHLFVCSCESNTLISWYLKCVLLFGITGVMFSGKPLYVAIAQRKEDRKARLQQRFAEFATMPRAASPVIPTGYPHVYFAHPSTHFPQGPSRQGFMYPPMGIGQEWTQNVFSSPHIPQMHAPLVCHCLDVLKLHYFEFKIWLKIIYFLHRCQIPQGNTETTGDGWLATWWPFPTLWTMCHTHRQLKISCPCPDRFNLELHLFLWVTSCC